MGGVRVWSGGVVGVMVEAFRCGGDLSRRSRGIGNVGVGVGVSSMLSKRADMLDMLELIRSSGEDLASSMGCGFRWIWTQAIRE